MTTDSTPMGLFAIIRIWTQRHGLCCLAFRCIHYVYSLPV